jgi:ketosteroid isomerase-like protein
MKRSIKAILLISLLMLTAVTTKAQTQSAKAPQPRYKDLVADNPNADADIKLVKDYLNLLVSGNADKAKSLLAENFMAFGPSPADSSNAEQSINSWKENYKTQLNRKFDLQAALTVRVLSGNYKGDWVDVWGIYSFTGNGKEISFPFQYTAKVANGKIAGDMSYYDNLYIVKKLGYTVTPPEMPSK